MKFYGLIGHGAHPRLDPFQVPENALVVFLQDLGSGLDESTAKKYWDHFAQIKKIEAISWPTHTYPPGSMCPELTIDMAVARHPREGLYDLENIRAIPWDEREGKSPYRSEDEAFNYQLVMKNKITDRQAFHQTYQNIRQKIETSFDAVSDNEFALVTFPASRQGNVMKLPTQIELSGWIRESNNTHRGEEIISVVFACRPVDVSLRADVERLEKLCTKGAPVALRSKFG